MRFLWIILFVCSNALAAEQQPATETAIFASGCFWCTESDFQDLPGVVSAVSGYTGGNVENPNYKQVTRGGTGHREALQVKFDPEKISYQQLLEVFWNNVDPLDDGGQFCDRGDSYRSAVFVTNEQQRQWAESSKQQRQAQLGDEIVTPILPASTFYPAEDYHQDYYQKNPLRYKFYRYNCGRDARLEALQQQLNSN